MAIFFGPPIVQYGTFQLRMTSYSHPKLWSAFSRPDKQDLDAACQLENKELADAIFLSRQRIADKKATETTVASSSKRQNGNNNPLYQSKYIHF